MDAIDLLAREDEYRKLNKQLEKKTESLMKEIEHVMQKQDFFSEFTQNTYHNQTKKHCCETPKPYECNNAPAKIKSLKKHTLTRESPKRIENSNLKYTDTNTNAEIDNSTQNDCTDSANDINGVNICTNCTRKVICDCCTIQKNNMSDDMEFLYAFVSVNVQDKVLPQSFLKDRVTVQSVCKFLASKAKLMQEHIDKLQATIDKKASQCEAHLSRYAELEGERMSLLNKSNHATALAAELRAKCGALHNKLADKERLYTEQRSEADKLTTEVKRLRSKNASVEARCAMQEEVIGTLKQQLETARIAQKEFRDSSRSLSASHENAISRLEARIKGLTLRIDKQAALIDNLRRQNVLLSTEAAVKALEREYGSFLSQDF